MKSALLIAIAIACITSAEARQAPPPPPPTDGPSVGRPCKIEFDCGVQRPPPPKPRHPRGDKPKCWLPEGCKKHHQQDDDEDWRDYL